MNCPCRKDCENHGNCSACFACHMEKGGTRMACETAFIASIIDHGVLGGGLYVSQNGLRWRCQKASIDNKLKNVYIPMAQLSSLKWMGPILPVFEIRTCEGERYKFLVLNRRHFETIWMMAKTY